MASNEAAKAFFQAVKANDIPKTVELLKTKVVDVDKRDETNNDRTALHIAAFNGHYELARSLVDDYNADVNAKDSLGKIPFQLACDSYKMKTAKYLLKRNSDAGTYGERYLNDEKVDELFEAAEKNDIEKVVKMLKENEVDVDSEDKGNNNRTILEIAASNGYEELVRILVDDFDADIYHEDDLGDSAVHMVDKEHSSIVAFLRKRGWKDESPSDSAEELSDSNALSEQVTKVTM